MENLIGVAESSVGPELDPLTISVLVVEVADGPPRLVVEVGGHVVPLTAEREVDGPQVHELAVIEPDFVTTLVPVRVQAQVVERTVLDSRTVGQESRSFSWLTRPTRPTRRLGGAGLGDVRAFSTASLESTRLSLGWSAGMLRRIPGAIRRVSSLTTSELG